jgi:hypothetical protein
METLRYTVGGSLNHRVVRGNTRDKIIIEYETIPVVTPDWNGTGPNPANAVRRFLQIAPRLETVLAALIAPWNRIKDADLEARVVYPDPNVILAARRLLKELET